MPRRKRPNPQSEETIRRIDTKPRAKKQTHGFQVHFLRGDRVVTRMFSDNVYGGKQAARRAARKFKKSMLRRLPRRKFLGGLILGGRKSISVGTPSNIVKSLVTNSSVTPRATRQLCAARNTPLVPFLLCSVH